MSASVAKEGGGKNSGDALDDAFEDLEARFLLNLPREELETIHRLFFQIDRRTGFTKIFSRMRPRTDLCPTLGLRCVCRGNVQAVQNAQKAQEAR